MSVVEKTGRRSVITSTLGQATAEVGVAVTQFAETVKENVLDFVDLKRTPEASWYEPGEKVLLNKTETAELIRIIKKANKSGS